MVNSSLDSVSRAVSVAPAPPKKTVMLPRIGFFGAGWIGRQRIEAIARSGLAEIVAVADPAMDVAANAVSRMPSAAVCKSLEELLALDVDGIVIATPGALHADEVIKALEYGVSVFCQKPLGHNEIETRRVIGAARAADLLLSVDSSCRYMAQVVKVRDLVRQGNLGNVYAADLVFHNAHGSDQGWFYNRQPAGGGCVIELGIHLVDLALWILDFPRVTNVTSRLFAQGKPLQERSNAVEDHAIARLDLAGGTTVQMACSWKLPAGCDAIVTASFYGTKGGASFRNVNGSVYDFVVEHYSGTRRERLDSPAENWGAMAAIDWIRRLADGAHFDPEIQRLSQVAATLDAIYQP